MGNGADIENDVRLKMDFRNGTEWENGGDRVTTPANSSSKHTEVLEYP